MSENALRENNTEKIMCEKYERIVKQNKDIVKDNQKNVEENEI